MEKNIFENFSVFSSPSADLPQPGYTERQRKREISMENRLTLEDIDDRCRKRFDLYIKKVCKNALNGIWRQFYRSKEYAAGISVFSDVSESAVYVEAGFLRPEAVLFEIRGYVLHLDVDLAGLLNNLPEQHRIAFVLTTALNMPAKAAAELLGVSERTVKSYKKQALEKLREELSRYGWQ
jgi:DNA-directed RNA polymerase specialized sigma24 family protein